MRAGADRDNMTEIEDLWNPVEGRPLFRAVMSKNRFKFFLRCLRFDNYRTRRQRLAGDRVLLQSVAFGNSSLEIYDVTIFLEIH